MDILRAGRNDDGWFQDVACDGVESDGCGATLRITKEDLYKVLDTNLSIPFTGFFAGFFIGEQWRARFSCCACGVESDLDAAEKFDGLCSKDEKNIFMAHSS